MGTFATKVSYLALKAKFEEIEEQTMTTDFQTHRDLFVSPHSVKEPTALEDPKFEVNSSIKHEWAHFLKKKSFHPSKRSLIQTLHYINKMTKIYRCSKITTVIHNMLCIKVMDGLQAFMTTCVHMWECVCQTTCGWFLLLLYLHVRMPEEGKTVGILVFPSCLWHERQGFVGWMDSRLPNLKCWITGNFSKH